jgi:hypothetical protein
MNQNLIVLNQILLKPSSIIRFLGIISLLLIIASIGGQLITYSLGFDYVNNRHYLDYLIRLFYVDLAQNFPAYFSSFLLLFAALLLLVITLLERKRKTSQVSKWAILSLGFLGMAMNEALAFHERLIVPVRSLLNSDTFGIFYFAWVIPGIILVLMVAAFFLRFFLQLNSKTKLTFLIAATLYIGGVIGFELIDGYYAELHGQLNLKYSMLTNIEEMLEMSGIIIFIWGLLVYISDNFKEVQFRFDSVQEQSTSDNKG